MTQGGILLAILAWCVVYLVGRLVVVCAVTLC